MCVKYIYFLCIISCAYLFITIITVISINCFHFPNYCHGCDRLHSNVLKAQYRLLKLPAGGLAAAHAVFELLSKDLVRQKEIILVCTKIVRVSIWMNVSFYWKSKSFFLAVIFLILCWNCLEQTWYLGSSKVVTVALC